jgi:uncharacterized protein YbjT (DUF2867 family)
MLYFIDMEKVLVAGATGATGRHIVNLLKESPDFEPFAMIRKEDQKVPFEAQHINWVLGDLSEDIKHTCRDMDKVIFAAGSGGTDVVEIDQEGAKKLIDAAEFNKVKKFIMLSSMGTDQPEQSDDLQEYLKAKQNADRHLKNGILNYVIVRPGALTNENATNHIKLAHKLNSQGSISRADVAQTLVRVLKDGIADKETFEILKGEILISQAIDNNSVAPG